MQGAHGARGRPVHRGRRRVLCRAGAAVDCDGLRRRRRPRRAHQGPKGRGRAVHRGRGGRLDRAAGARAEPRARAQGAPPRPEAAEHFSDARRRRAAGRLWHLARALFDAFGRQHVRRHAAVPLARGLERLRLRRQVGRVVARRAALRALRTPYARTDGSNRRPRVAPERPRCCLPPLVSHPLIDRDAASVAPIDCSCFALPQVGSGDDAFSSSAAPAEPPSGPPGCRALRGLTTAGVCVWSGFHQGSPTP
mmetsp:Transcript_60452/g.159873  ORF Transcript_60452/g.159873 Transcript_60452/m.159873 type:complete len:251 (-) Transcript_60452:72-824(-)